MEAIMWMGVSLILQGEQYQRQLCGKPFPMQTTDGRLLTLCVIHELLAVKRPAMVFLGSCQHRWLNSIISIRWINSSGKSRFIVHNLCQLTEIFSIKKQNLTNTVIRVHAYLCFKWVEDWYYWTTDVDNVYIGSSNLKWTPFFHVSFGFPLH